MPNENALAMVLGHEIGHVKARDPISALGGSAMLSVTMALLSGQGEALGASLGQLVQRAARAVPSDRQMRSRSGD